MFRISNDVQRAKVQADIEGFKSQRENIEKAKGKKIAEVFWKGCKPLIKQYEQQIAQYLKLRQEGSVPFHGKDLRDLGAFLVDARIAAGMTQVELAKKLGVSQPMIYKYELNEYRGYSLEIIEKVVKEVASGMNDNRQKLEKLITSKPKRIVVEHKDRLTRFGFGYFDVLLPMIGCELVVIHRDKEEKDDLLKDLVAVITSFCCRLYGLRRGQSKAKEIKETLE